MYIYTFTSLSTLTFSLMVIKIVHDQTTIGMWIVTKMDLHSMMPMTMIIASKNVNIHMAI